MELYSNLSITMLQFFRSLPIAVEMKQISASESTTIKFTFTNNSDEIIYILKWYTPLEGMRSRFLNITFDKEELKYEGIMAKRSLPKAEHYICLEPQQSVDSTIDLTESYTFPYDGEYTIQYIKPLVFLTEEMYKNFDDRLVPYFNHPEHSSIAVVTAKKKKKGRGVFQPNHNCEQCMAQLNKEEEEREIRKFEEMFCANYNIVIDAIYAEDNMFYEKWFGKGTYYQLVNGEMKDQFKTKVEQTFTACFEKLSERDENYLPLDNEAQYANFRSGCIYLFGGGDCKSRYYAVTIYNPEQPNFESLICLCCLYFKTPKISLSIEEDNREQILVHEWTHAFGFTNRHYKEIYTPAECQELANANGQNVALAEARRRTSYAIENADTYGYFYWDVIHHHESKLCRNLNPYNLKYYPVYDLVQ